MNLATAFHLPSRVCDAIALPRRLLRLLMVALCFSFAQPFAAVAQTSAAPLSPAAQEALDKGIIAARVPDYLLAIRYFEEARALAPQAPVVFLNMGLAESKIPGRELRAMAWFGAYMAAYPDAPNGAAVKEQMGVLEVRSKSNLLRLVKFVEDAAMAVQNSRLVTIPPMSAAQSKNLRLMAGLWAEAGEMTLALKTTDLIQDAEEKSIGLSAIASHQIEAGDLGNALKTLVSAEKSADLIRDDLRSGQSKSWARSSIAVIQAEAGEIAAAQKTSDLIRDDERDKSRAQRAIVRAQIKSGNMAGAQKTAELIQYDGSGDKSWAQAYIAEAQAKASDIAGAQKTADLIQAASIKSWAQAAIAGAQAMAGDIAGAQKTANLMQVAGDQRVAQSAITRAQAVAGTPPSPTQRAVSAWLARLDGSLNSEHFLDLTGYLKSPLIGPSLHAVKGTDDRLKILPKLENPQSMFEKLRATAQSIAGAQNNVIRALKQQAKP